MHNLLFHTLLVIFVVERDAKICRRTIPRSDNITGIVAGIHMLASALAEDTMSRIQGFAAPTLAITVANAIKILAEAIVNVSVLRLIFVFNQFSIARIVLNTNTNSKKF